MACVYWIEDSPTVAEQVREVSESSKTKIKVFQRFSEFKDSLDSDMAQGQPPRAIVWDLALGGHTEDDKGQEDAEEHIREYRSQLGQDTYFAVFSDYPSTRLNRLRQKMVDGVPLIDLGLTKMFYSTEAAAYRVMNESKASPEKEFRPDALNGLWLEDSMVQAEMIKDAFENLGHNITVVSNLDELAGKLGVVLANAGEYDFIGYDLEVAGENAFGTVIRNREFTPESTVVVVYTSSTDRANYLQKNGHCDLGLSKKIYHDPHDVGAHVEHLIQMRSRKKAIGPRPSL